MQCMMGGGESFPGIWDNIPQPQLKENYKSSNPCTEDSKHKDNDASSDISYNPILTNTEEDDTHRMASLRKKKNFFHNLYADEWSDYTNWGVDKRTSNLPEKHHEETESHLLNAKRGGMEHGQKETRKHVKD